MTHGARVGRVTAAAAWLLVRLRWPIVLAWAAATVAATLYLPSLEDAGDETSLVGLVPKDAEALSAGLRSAELFSVPVITHTMVVQRDPDGFSEPAVRRILRRAERIADERDPELAEIRFALPLVNARGLVPSARETATTAITYLFFDPETDIARQDALTRRYAEKYVRFRDDGLVGVTGAVPARMAEWREIERGLPWVTAATIALIALIIGVTFRSVVAPAVTLAAAGVAYVVSLRTVGVVGDHLGVAVPRDAEPILVVLLLGVVTDYAVFFLAGMRERLLAGETRLQAAEGATAEYLPIVVTAGLIVAGGTAALLAGQLEFFRAFGPGMALTVLLSLVAAITLVPAAMAILGERLFWPSRLADAPAPSDRPGRLARFAAWRPVALVIVVASLAALVFAGRGLQETNLGLTQISGLPADSEPKRAAEAASEGFAAGILSPTVLLVEGVDRRLDLAALVRLERLLRREPGIASSIGPAQRAAREVPGLVLAQRSDAARYLLILDENPQGGPAIDAVERLRERMPTLLEQAGLDGADVRLAGDTALADETVQTIKHDLLRIGVAAFLVNLLLLALFLRALVAPLYLVFASALALAASIGLTTLLFQGFLGHDELTYHVPFAVAVLLLSLGSDYNVFVVGRIWSAAEERPLREAIAVAAPRASRAIAVAGLALAFSFAALALIELRQFREFGAAMLLGVLLDAFLIRALLIPALISLVGARSWWPLAPPRPTAAQAPVRAR
ncbi:MAG TPA: MMPL family transporter [Gaiellaceae bacterium]|nr:MMPL family transporter [Gaiellaceae bacterium]